MEPVSIFSNLIRRQPWYKEASDRIAPLTHQYDVQEQFFINGGEVPPDIVLWNCNRGALGNGVADTQDPYNVFEMDHEAYDNKDWHVEYTKAAKHVSIGWFMCNCSFAYDMHRIGCIPDMKKLRQQLFDTYSRDADDVDEMNERSRRIRDWLTDMDFSVISSMNQLEKSDGSSLVIVNSQQDMDNNISMAPCAFVITNAYKASEILNNQQFRATQAREQSEDGGDKKKKTKRPRFMSPVAKPVKRATDNKDQQNVSVKIFSASANKNSLSIHMTGCATIAQLHNLMVFVYKFLTVAYVYKPSPVAAAAADAAAAPSSSAAAAAAAAAAAGYGWTPTRLTMDNIIATVGSKVEPWHSPSKLNVASISRDDFWMSKMQTFLIKAAGVPCARARSDSGVDLHLVCNTVRDKVVINIRQGGGMKSQGLKHLYFQVHSPFAHSHDILIKIHVNCINITGKMTHLDMAYVYWLLSKYINKYNS